MEPLVVLKLPVYVGDVVKNEPPVCEVDQTYSGHSSPADQVWHPAHNRAHCTHGQEAGSPTAMDARAGMVIFTL